MKKLDIKVIFERYIFIFLEEFKRSDYIKWFLEIMIMSFFQYDQENDGTNQIWGSYDRRE